MFQKVFYDAEANPAGGNPAPQPVTPPSPDGKTLFTQEQLNAIIAKELAKVEAKSAQKQKEIEETEKLKTMTETQKQALEFQKIKDELATFKRGQFAAEYKAQLIERGLPGELAQVMPVEDAEKAQIVLENLEKFKITLLAEKDKRIEELEKELKNAGMRGTPPKSVNTPTGGTGTVLKTIY